ncbi:MAG: hypothetical protein ABEJ70_01665 [Halobacteriaceae archaeon]
MDPLTIAFAVNSTLLVVAGLTMVGLAVRAYMYTERTSMIHLSIGFTLVVAASIATVVSTFLRGFEPAKSLLMVNSGITSAGYVFVVYSLVSYE